MEYAVFVLRVFSRPPIQDKEIQEWDVHLDPETLAESP